MQQTGRYLYQSDNEHDIDKTMKTMPTVIICPVEPQGLVSIVQVVDCQTQGHDKQCSAAIVQVISMVIC